MKLLRRQVLLPPLSCFLCLERIAPGGASCGCPGYPVACTGLRTQEEGLESMTRAPSPFVSWPPARSSWKKGCSWTMLRGQGSSGLGCGGGEG